MFTVTTMSVAHPEPESVYDIVVVPVANPEVKMPKYGSIEATVVLLLLQYPPELVSVKVFVELKQTAVGPVIEEGVGAMVIEKAA